MDVNLTNKNSRVKRIHDGESGMKISGRLLISRLFSFDLLQKPFHVFRVS